MKKIVCDICRQSLVSCYIEKQQEYAFHLLKLKNKGGLVTPSQGTVKILMLIEKSLTDNECSFC